MNHAGSSETYGKSAGNGGASPYFSRSASQTQAYHAPQTAQEATAQGGPAFSRSRSEPQAIVQAEKVKDERHGVTWRLKNAFLKSENMISTWMTLGFIKGWVDKTMGAWGVASPMGKLTGQGTALGDLKARLPSIPGAEKMSALAYGKNFDKSKLTTAGSHKPQSFFEKTMAVGVTGSLLQNLTFFMTARGGEIPDGDNMTQRTINSLKHADKHSVHFSTATMTAFISIIGASRVGLGIKGMMDPARKPEDMKKNVTLLVSGLSGLIAAPLVFTGMFKIKKNDKPDPQAEKAKQAEMMDKAEQAFSKDKSGDAKPAKTSTGKGLIASLKPAHLKDMWAYALKNDRMGLLGRALSVVVELGFIVNGRLELKNDPTNAGAYKTVKGGLTGLVLTCMQTHFVYDRLLTNSQKSASPAR